MTQNKFCFILTIKFIKSKLNFPSGVKVRAANLPFKVLSVVSRVTMMMMS